VRNRKFGFFVKEIFNGEVYLESMVEFPVAKPANGGVTFQDYEAEETLPYTEVITYDTMRRFEVATTKVSRSRLFRSAEKMRMYLLRW
jgi:hypothetical protein